MSTAKHVRAEGFGARTSGVRALLGIAVALAVVGGVVVATHDDETDAETVAEVDRTGDDSTTSTRRSTTVPDDEADEAADGSTAPTLVDDAPSDRLEPLITGGTKRARATGSATLSTGCRNAVASGVADPADCGPFRWDPVPANRPAELEVLVSHGQAPVGQPVTFTTRWADPDAPNGHIRISGLRPGCADDCPTIDPPACDDDRIGPWDPPRAAAGADDFVYTVDDLAPGTYDWTVTLTTASVGEDLAGCDRDPYASGATVTGTLVVHPLLTPLGDEQG